MCGLYARHFFVLLKHRHDKRRTQNGAFRSVACAKGVSPLQPCAVLRTWSGLRPDTPPTPHGTRNFFAYREALAGCRGAVLTRFVEPHRVAKGCPLWHKRRSETPRFVYAAYRACVLGEQKNAVHTAHTMTHIITHNSKHTAHTITHTLTHKKDHNPIDTPQNNPHKRRVNHFAVFVPQPFRAIDKLAVRESHEVRTYTNSP